MRNEGPQLESELNTIMSTVTVAGLIIFTVIFGRAFCSWICPYGTFFTYFGKVKKEKKDMNFKILQL